MANPLNLLKSLLPSDTVQVGEIVTVNADKTARVQLVGGGIVTAAGSGYTVGTPVFIKGSQILSQAPSLSVQDIEV